MPVLKVCIMLLPTFNYNQCLLDYNECATSNGGCSQNCDNTDGSFQCSCNNGYLLDSDEASCNGWYLPTENTNSHPYLSWAILY